jgi:hypothetical protein
MKHTVLTILLSGFLMAGIAQTTLDTALNFSVKDTYEITFNLFDVLDEQMIVVIDFFSTE